MMNNVLKVYNEDLINSAINVPSIESAGVVEVGSTQCALCVNVFAVGATSTSDTWISISLKHCDTKDGIFAEFNNITIGCHKNFADGELIETFILPQNVKAYLMATATSATSNSGKIRVTLGYLAR